MFLWESGGKSRVVGLAQVVSVSGFHRNEWRFHVRYVTAHLECMPTIDELRRLPALKTATFLKPAIYRTVYPLTLSQAKALYHAVTFRNPMAGVWRTLPSAASIPDVDRGAIEANRQLITHLRIERAPGLSKKKKSQFRREHEGRLFCESCGGDFLQYGLYSNAVFEVHHRRPLGKAKPGMTTKMSDLAVLCSNCHRAIHRYVPVPGVRKLRADIRPKVTAL